MKALRSLTLTIAVLALGCAGTTSSKVRTEAPPVSLVGAWHASVQFKTGAFAAVKDLEFMYVFNAGGTMTESSNYDAAPPVPPAYGVWRQTGPRQFEAKYAFYTTKPPANFEELANGKGWTPAGHGELLETITISADGRRFISTIRYDEFDAAGKPTETGSVAETKAARLEF